MKSTSLHGFWSDVDDEAWLLKFVLASLTYLPGTRFLKGKTLGWWRSGLICMTSYRWFHQIQAYTPYFWMTRFHHPSLRLYLLLVPMVQIRSYIEDMWFNQQIPHGQAWYISSLIKQGLVKLGTFKLLIVVSAGVGLYIGWYQTQGPDYENDPNVHGADRHSLKVELHLKRRRVAYTLIAFFELFLTVLFMLWFIKCSI